MKAFTGADIAAMDDRYRVFFVNALSGFKSANLVGTTNGRGHDNLAMFSSVVHLGSNPPLLGMVSRPHSVRRDTLENIRSTGYYTVNHVHADFFEAAHQASARYDAEVSEFEAVGLTARHGNHPAPYVAESPLQIGLAHRQTIDLDINGTCLVIGEVVEVHLEDTALAQDGSIDLGRLGSLAVAGLDGYYAPTPLARLSYAKPDQPVRRLQAEA
jgi:flavin reductase (DIM6/NTAB) family NADH-FMN oxidoreductase RutF